MHDRRLIDVAKDFSPRPFGRYRSDGGASGERFRDDFLLPELLKPRPVTVYLDGVRSFGSSWLEEAFGGLIRHGVDREIVNQNLEIETSRPDYKSEIWSYIRDAKNVLRNG